MSSLSTLPEALNELRLLSHAVQRAGLKAEYWEEGEYITVCESGPVGMTLAKDEADALNRAVNDVRRFYHQGIVYP
jgi:hypothetical protein